METRKFLNICENVFRSNSELDGHHKAKLTQARCDQRREGTAGLNREGVGWASLRHRASRARSAPGNHCRLCFEWGSVGRECLFPEEAREFWPKQGFFDTQEQRSAGPRRRSCPPERHYLMLRPFLWSHGLLFHCRQNCRPRNAPTPVRSLAVSFLARGVPWWAPRQHNSGTTEARLRRIPVGVP